MNDRILRVTPGERLTEWLGLKNIKTLAAMGSSEPDVAPESSRWIPVKSLNSRLARLENYDTDSVRVR